MSRSLSQLMVGDKHKVRRAKRLQVGLQLRRNFRIGAGHSQGCREDVWRAVPTMNQRCSNPWRSQSLAAAPIR